MNFLDPDYRHIPTMVPSIHKDIPNAFPECIDQLSTVIRKHNLQDHVVISLLHKHSDIREGQRYVEYFHGNHLIQVMLTDDIIGFVGVALSPYSFYFRNTQVFEYEYTTFAMDRFGFPEFSHEFLENYSDVLRSSDLEDVFGIQFNYKSQVLGSARLIEKTINNVSITSVRKKEKALDLDTVVRTAWSAKVEAECCSCHHCWGHPICHPHGCVDIGAKNEGYPPVGHGTI